MKKYLIAGNWKMNTSPLEAKELALNIIKELEPVNVSENIDILICPPYTNLWLVKETIQGSIIKLGSQNCYFEKSGAYTGEISINMLKETGCSYVIIGHSERRAIFNETDDIINKKVHAVLENGLTPILCIGETLKERQNEETNKVLECQLNNGLKNIMEQEATKIVIAYEPVWAIGTGVSATTEQVEETHQWIKDWLSRRFSIDKKEIILLYGGSMSPKNSKELLALEDVNGGLIGGASLKAQSFVEILKSAL